MCAMQVNEFDSSDEESLGEEQTPFQVSWLPLSPAYSQFLGISSLPGCRFKNIKRNLQKDIDELKSHGVLDVFVLCTKRELIKYRVPHLVETYQNYGITVHHHPISDGSTPDIARCCVILNELRNCLENKRKITIHCYGGLGRSCLMEACLLLQISDTVTPQQAIDCVRELRGSGAIQTLKQYNFLYDFPETLATYLATESKQPRSVSR
ncbi:cyclin-dependent kinase inhibitor 3 isoform X1 [Crotalus tigris]|uniref:cyclin-dependent kinase inhibitor 3 isoform X1 n=1 Tax=Crotalus tigris TaxID=88082 RepID=UPI00192F6AD3|nr:cyclin-dependent kinase inhibitor 3 isoform X1 [Crotalus tigris]XP_039176973.1 cyclin-dependent kinase inhibitor 3 isoform X1 [Crotalus tigris]XP_039176983.1 cyclin-dependent kinase inhibitor 3 isoform X1 [Crotalus tigris]